MRDLTPRYPGSQERPKKGRYRPGVKTVDENRITRVRLADRGEATQLSDTLKNTFEAAKSDVALVAKLEKLDRIYGLTKRNRDMILEKFAGEILQNPQVFARLSFASGLVGPPVSPFFLALSKNIKRLEGNLTGEQLLPVLAAFRRAEMYKEMSHFVGLGNEKLKDLGSKEASTLNSKILYEQHMAAYQEAKKAEERGDRLRASELFERSRKLAERSASEASSAGDMLGKLYALMNVSGLLPGESNERIKLSEDVCRQAEEFARSSADVDSRKRAERIAMNTYLHRIRISLPYLHEAKQEDFQKWLDGLFANDVYQESRVGGKEPEWALQEVTAVQAFIAERK